MIEYTYTTDELPDFNVTVLGVWHDNSFEACYYVGGEYGWYSPETEERFYCPPTKWAIINT